MGGAVFLPLSFLAVLLWLVLQFRPRLGGVEFSSFFFGGAAISRWVFLLSLLLLLRGGGASTPSSLFGWRCFLLLLWAVLLWVVLLLRCFRLLCRGFSTFLLFVAACSIPHASGWCSLLSTRGRCCFGSFSPPPPFGWCCFPHYLSWQCCIGWCCLPLLSPLGRRCLPPSSVGAVILLTLVVLPFPLSFVGGAFFLLSLGVVLPLPLCN